MLTYARPTDKPGVVEIVIVKDGEPVVARTSVKGMLRMIDVFVEVMRGVVKEVPHE